jgi:hypothetical protein
MLTRYRELLTQLQQAERAGDESLAESILTRLDEVWYGLSPADRSELDSDSEDERIVDALVNKRVASCAITPLSAPRRRI